MNDLARFCCDPFEFCILTINPTFCLADFDVVPATSSLKVFILASSSDHWSNVVSLQESHFRHTWFFFCITIDWTEERVRIISMPLELMAKKPSLMPSPTSFAHFHPQNAYYVTNTIHHLISTIWYRPFRFSY